MFTKSTKQRREKLGFIRSMRLAGKIVVGSLRLLARYPILVLPLVPVFIMVLLITVAIPYIETLGGFMVILMAIFGVAAGLMISFGGTGQMLKQLHDGRNPSLGDAVLSPDMARMVPRVLGLSALWYGAVLVLVTIETIIRALLDRISEDLGDAVVRAIFGTIADALRMMGFMMVAIMTFEDVGLGPAFERLKAVVKDQAIVAAGGLVLTNLATGFIAVILYTVSQLLDGFAPGTASFLLLVPVLALGWLLAMYLEQLFVTGLYLYSTVPDSPIVTILLQDVIGHELPEPGLAGEAVT
jgi:hypothetical protein